jgi:3-oxoacyl-[acyl-carrier protein] reductase
MTVHYHRAADAAQVVCEEIEKSGGAAHPVGFDAADREACASVLAREVGERGAFWGVVHNAGVAADAAFPAMTGEQWDSVLRTNLDGFYNVVQPLVMPMVRGREGGRIVAISSVAGLAGNRGQVNYAASKAGLIAAVKSLARELAKRRITVNSVAPGLIETDMLAGKPLGELAKGVPMQRLGKPEEVAATVAFLFSEGANYITGEVISVNGGLY